MTTTRTINWTYILVAVIVRAFMLGAAAISFMHIVTTGRGLGLGWEAWTVPAFVDGLAVLGLIGRSARFAASTQRAGLRLMTGAGLLSLACNVYAGSNLGQRLYGVLVVAGFVTAEWYAMKLRPAPVAPAGPTPEEIAIEVAAAEVAAKRSEAARKAAATRAANRRAAMSPQQKAAATRKARRELADPVAAVRALPADAPVSPGI